MWTRWAALAAVVMAGCGGGGAAMTDGGLSGEDGGPLTGATCAGRVYVIGDAGELDFQTDGEIVSRQPVGGPVVSHYPAVLPCVDYGQIAPLVPCTTDLPDGGQEFTGCK